LEVGLEIAIANVLVATTQNLCPDRLACRRFRFPKSFSTLFHCPSDLLLAFLEQFSNLSTGLLNFGMDGIHPVFAFTRNPFTSVVSGLWS
jgi:hypothetical protein